jgi:general secretion pathway protein E
MLHNSFMEHLAAKGVVADGGLLDGPSGRRRDGATQIDWLALTKLAPAAFADELAAFYRCARAQRTDLVGGRFAGAELSARFLKSGRLFPYEDRSGALNLAIAAPVDDETIIAAEVALKRAVTITVATVDDIEAALGSTLEADSFDPTGQVGPEASETDLDALRDLAHGAPVVRALDELLRLAVEQRATDMHIEPFGTVLHVRFRIDGLLKPVSSPPVGMAKGLLSRLKIMAGLNITERRMPQDGRTRIMVGGAEIDLRIATMPTMHGESAVIRLLRKGSGLVALEQIGLSTRDEAVLRATLQAPFGMIIVTGPTGSGKTTTLAASLAAINEPHRKILTVEDPVEYQLPGVNQTQVQPAIGLTFASAMRSFLRQDPDIIMVGEMRDAETAHIGVHAALTGHLVLTTLHTNTAAGAITRLIDMGVESFLLASSVRAIVGQRLVRMLCLECKQQRRLVPGDLARDQRYAAVGLTVGDTVWEPKGCDWCGHSGYRGRRGVFEVIEVSPAIREAIGPRTEAAQLEAVARQYGMTTMIDDGIAKCRVGLTTVDEIYRVIMSI